MKLFKVVVVAACFMVAAALTGCNGGSSASANGQGAVSAKLVMKGASSLPSNVATIRINVSGMGMSTIQQDFPAANGGGVINGVPTGISVTVTASALDASGNHLSVGSVINVTVQAGQTTDVGTVTLEPLSALTTITVTPSNPNIAAGATQQLTATGQFSDGSTVNMTSTVTWNSSITSIATIATNGIATAMLPGTTTITAATGAVSGTASLSVQGSGTHQTQLVASTGKYHSTSYVLRDGVLFGWGANSSYELLNNTTTNVTTPAIINAITNIKYLAVGDYSAIALKSDGTVYAWGNINNADTTGLPVFSTSQPAQVSGLSNVTSIAAGIDSAFALKSDGTVWAWGQNSSGELGDGTTTDRATPVQVAGLSNVVSIASGGHFSVALKNDGTVWMWGSVYASDTPTIIGVPDSVTCTTITTPTLVSGISGITKIAAGARFVAALDDNGNVWTWGANTYGQLGDGTTTGRTNPVIVPGILNATTIAAGNVHVAALKNDGTVWTWGSNAQGELGNGSTSNSPVPIRVTGLSNVIDIGAGVLHTIAIESDGSVWTFGINDCGQIGNGTTTNQNTPVKIM